MILGTNAKHIINRTSRTSNTGNYLSRLRGSSIYGRKSRNNGVRCFHLLQGNAKRDDNRDVSCGGIGFNRFVNVLGESDRCGYTQIMNLASLDNFSRSPFLVANTASPFNAMATRSLSTSARSSSSSLRRLKSTVSGGDSQRTDDDAEDKSRKEKIQSAARKGAFKVQDKIQKYGWPFIATYLSVYVATLASLYGGLDSGLIDPSTLSNIEVPWHPSGGELGDGGTTDREDFNSAVELVASYMKKFSWTEPYADAVSKNPRLSNLAIAWVATKLTEPLRLAASIAIVRTMTKK